MGLRAEQVELTRRRILESFVELSADPARDKVTIAELARYSGISPATIYRHFENRDELVYAAATLNLEHGGAVPPGGPPWTVAELGRHLHRIWTEMAANISVAREATITETGRELREARFLPFRTMMRDAVDASVAGGEHPHLDDAVACLAVLTSAHAFLDMHDRQGLDVDRAVGAVEWGFAALLAAVGVPMEDFSIAPADRSAARPAAGNGKSPSRKEPSS